MIERLASSSSSPESPNPYAGVDVGGIVPEQTGRTWRDSFTNQKVGYLTSEELDHIMSFEDGENPPRPPEAPSGPLDGQGPSGGAEISGGGQKTLLEQHTEYMAQKAEQDEKDEALLASAPREWVTRSDERFGRKGTLAILRGEGAPQAEDNDERPMLTHASTGEQVGMPEVKAKLAEADERRIRRGTSDIATGLSEHFKAGESGFSAEEVRSSETGQVFIVEQGELDENHSVEVVLDAESGKIEDVTVTASETNEQGQAEVHTVEVSTPDQAPEIRIDGQAAEEAEVPIAEAVLEHTAEQLHVVEAPAEETAEPAPAEHEAEPAVEQEKAPEPTDEEKLKTGMKQAVMPYLRGNKAALEAIGELGMSPEDIGSKLSSNEFNTDEQAVAALQHLIKEVTATSSIWSENPNTDSLTGRAAQESRKLLKQTLKTLFS